MSHNLHVKKNIKCTIYITQICWSTLWVVNTLLPGYFSQQKSKSANFVISLRVRMHAFWVPFDFYKYYTFIYNCNTLLVVKMWCICLRELFSKQDFQSHIRIKNQVSRLCKENPSIFSNLSIIHFAQILDF